MFFSGGQFLAIIFTVFPLLLGGWIAFLVHRSDQDEPVKIPRLIPWSIGARIRRTKAMAELAHAQTVLAEVKHTKVQKEMVLTDLENESYKRTLSSGNNPEN